MMEQATDILQSSKEFGTAFYMFVTLGSIVVGALATAVVKLYKDNQKKDQDNLNTLKDMSAILSSLEKSSISITPDVVKEVHNSEGRIVKRMEDLNK